ncbi:MAG: hypothetical protein LUG91_07795 [Ruminococcus sp.]|nr:hypothetical protein [Ruminococcus sp.]
MIQAVRKNKLQNFNGISAKEKVDYTKLGMAVVNKFSDKGIHANVSVNLSTTVSIDLCNFNIQWYKSTMIPFDLRNAQ